MQDILGRFSVSKDAEVTSKDQLWVQEVAVDNPRRLLAEETAVSDPDQALRVLRSQPGIDAFGNVLDYLYSTTFDNHGFNIKRPGSKASLILNALVGSTIPDYWRILQPNSSLKAEQTPQALQSVVRSSEKQPQLVHLLNCLSSVGGLGALEARLRALLNSAEDATHKVGKSALVLQICDLLDVLVLILGRDESFILDRWIELDRMGNKHEKILIWRELLGLLCTGRLLSVAAQSLVFVNGATKETNIDCWVADGPKFSRWLGRNIAYMARNTPHESLRQWDDISQTVSKSFGLGYTDIIVEEVYSELLFGPVYNPISLLSVIDRLPRHQQRHFVDSVLRHVARHLSAIADRVQKSSSIEDEMAVAGAASVITVLIGQNDFLKEYLISWLVGGAGGLGDCLPILKAVIAAIGVDQDRIETVLEKSVQQFGDKLYVKHTPILLQEANVRVLLLSAGCIHRSKPSYVVGLARSSIYLNAISNRLATSSSRSRLLGMIVANAISDLVDDPDKRMVFSMDELKSSEVANYMSLTKTQLKAGSDDEFDYFKKSMASAQIQNSKRNRSIGVTTPSEPLATKENSKAKTIEAVNERSITSDNGLIPYEKPDSDREDEEEDPTLVNRTKHNPPVYIRELIDGLRDSENYERQRMALSTASSLVRRKSAFGTEVSTHAEELATILTGLHDKFDMENFQKWRLQGTIAVLVSQPVRMGQWFAKAFFDGDYSMSQRASILTTLGMGARELGGYKDEDVAATGAYLNPKTSFPSKLLPEKLHKAFGEEMQPVNALAAKMEKTMIQPMALKAADKLVGPDALKVRTFSSRMEVDKKRKKPIQNELAKVVADGFFYPLTGRWWMQLRAFGTKTIYFSPFLLSYYIKTLAIILHASGTSTISLPQMTSEFWDLLLSVASHPSNESTVLEALLFAFLTILEMNEDKRRLAEEQSRELLETQRWTETVFENTAGGDEETDKLKMLAASVLIKIKEVVEKYQSLLIGEMI